MIINISQSGVIRVNNGDGVIRMYHLSTHRIQIDRVGVDTYRIRMIQRGTGVVDMDTTVNQYAVRAA